MKIFEKGWGQLVMYGAILAVVWYLIQQKQKQKIAEAQANIDAKDPRNS